MIFCLWMLVIDGDSVISHSCSKIGRECVGIGCLYDFLKYCSPGMFWRCHDTTRTVGSGLTQAQVGAAVSHLYGNHYQQVAPDRLI